MNPDITGAAIRRLRKAKSITQAELARRIGVSSKAVSKWETGKGLPDISLLQPLAQELGVSLSELMSGIPVTNRNIACNMLRVKIHVCPICGNIIPATGDASISCCGTPLLPLKAVDADEDHRFAIQPVEDEYFISSPHEMTKAHFISFAAYVTTDRIQLVKFYPEGNAETRFPFRAHGWLYTYCSCHGLMKQKIGPLPR